MSGAKGFYQNLSDDLRRAVKSVMPFRATANGDAAGKVSIIRLGQALADGESYGRLDGFDIAAGDDLVCFTIGGKPVVAKLLNAAPSSHTLTGALEVTGAITGASFNSPIIAHVSQSGADTSSTTSTSTYATAASVSVSLGAGTWKIYAIGGADFQHSASGSMTFVVAIGGDESGSRALAMSATAWQTGIDSAELNSLTGNVTVSIKYRSSAAGTTSARNPWLLVIATRSS